MRKVAKQSRVWREGMRLTQTLPKYYNWSLSCGARKLGRKLNSLRDSIRPFKHWIPRKLAFWGSKDGVFYLKTTTSQYRKCEEYSVQFCSRCHTERRTGRASPENPSFGITTKIFRCVVATDLKVFVVVIPKEGLAGWGPANPSLGMTPTIKYYSSSLVD